MHQLVLQYVASAGMVMCVQLIGLPKGKGRWQLTELPLPECVS